MARIFLSPPDLGPDERGLVLDALDSNWVSPLGPHVDSFEQELASRSGRAHATALSSGTAALHLALILLGVERGDDVLVPSLTFAASANAVVYVGGNPVFVDSERATWCIDPDLVAETLAGRAARGTLPKAVITVDLYGQCADYDRLVDVCATYDVPLLADAAEALGATYRDKPAGAFGTMAVFSFNGNKIITTSGGGMLVADDPTLTERARFLATQARDPAPHYEHSTIGFNYRMSNILAALGRGQLRTLDDKVARRQEIKRRYRAGLGDLPGVDFMPDAPEGSPTNWLTVMTLDPARTARPDEVRLALEAEDIEARPAWKPMHLQPVFAEAVMVGGAVAAEIFDRGLCLPSGSSLTDEQQDRVISLVREVLGRADADRVNEPGGAPCRVLWLVKGLGPGGAEQLLVNQAAVRDRDRFVTEAVYLVPWKEHLVPRLADEGVPAECLGSGRDWDLRWAWRLRRRLRHRPVDVIHHHSPLVGSMTRLLVRTLPRRVRPGLVYTEHNRWPRHKRLTRLLNRLTFSLDDQTFAVSDDVRATIAPRLRGRVEVLVHGVDVDEVQAHRAERDEVRRELGVGADEVVVGIVANFRREKAYEVWVEAARLAEDAGLPMRFVSVGQGPLEAEIRAMVSTLGLDGYVQLLGYRDDALRVMSAFDIFTLSSRHEGLPVSLMEALAMGLPVVATKVGGVAEAVTDEVEALLVPADDPTALAGAYVQVAGDHELRARLAASAATRGLGFGMAAPTRRLERAYLEVAAPKASSSRRS